VTVPAWVIGLIGSTDVGEDPCTKALAVDRAIRVIRVRETSVVSSAVYRLPISDLRQLAVGSRKFKSIEHTQEELMLRDYSRILTEFAAEVRARYPGAQVWAFGSHVRGTATSESDLDLCVVLPHMSPADRLAISDIAWEASLVNDLHLTTVVFAEEDFQDGTLSANPLRDAILSDGIAA